MPVHSFLQLRQRAVRVNCRPPASRGSPRPVTARAVLRLLSLSQAAVPGKQWCPTLYEHAAHKTLLTKHFWARGSLGLLPTISIKNLLTSAESKYVVQLCNKFEDSCPKKIQPFKLLVSHSSFPQIPQLHFPSEVMLTRNKMRKTYVTGIKHL